MASKDKKDKGKKNQAKRADLKKKLKKSLKLEDKSVETEVPTPSIQAPAQPVARPGAFTNFDLGFAPRSSRLAQNLTADIVGEARKANSKPQVEIVEPSKRLLDRITGMEANSSLNGGMRLLAEREQDFSTPLACKLAGISVMPDSADALANALDEEWSTSASRDIATMYPDGVVPEVIIGGGLHASIYAAVRVAGGYPAPLVLEASERAGGIMGMSRGPSFFLNSRNRPGELSIPGRGNGALNVIPGGVVQPSDLSGDEYQRNSDLAFAIRMTLANSANVMTGMRVVAIDADNSGAARWLLSVGGREIRAQRVIAATGLGEPRRVALDDYGQRVLAYPEFMAMMDRPFPMRGMKTVAVVGTGDSGKTVVEALCGQGPTQGWSMASLDFPDRIDWYGLPADQGYRRGYERCNRSRYSGIARLLPREEGARVGRLWAMPERAREVGEGYGCGYVNERPYDYVIDCTGFRPDRVAVGDGVRSRTDVDGNREYQVGRRFVARNPADELFVVGVGANLPLIDLERESIQDIAKVEENSTSLFRYGGRTAALANSLGLPGADRKRNGTKRNGARFDALRAKVGEQIANGEVNDVDNIAGAPEASVVGVDKNGLEIRVGDYVAVTGTANPRIILDQPGGWKVLGKVDGRRRDARIALAAPGGGFAVNGAETYEVAPKDVALVPRNVIYAADGLEFAVNDIVEQSSGRPRRVLGLVPSRQGNLLGLEPADAADRSNATGRVGIVKAFKTRAGTLRVVEAYRPVGAEAREAAETYDSRSDLGLVDNEGTPINKGDRVRFIGSSRFGEGEAIAVDRVADFRLSMDIVPGTTTNGESVKGYTSGTRRVTVIAEGI